MSSSGESVSQIDIELTGYLDGELAPDAHQALEQRLAADDALRARLKVLAAAQPPAEAFDLLIAAAPTDRLAATLRTAMAVAAPADRRWNRLAAAAAVVFLIVGATAGFAIARFALPSEVQVVSEPPNWRAVVAEYFDLYTDETLAAIPDDPALRGAELANAGAKLSI
jgi:anti-sigma factor RsiW